MARKRNKERQEPPQEESPTVGVREGRSEEVTLKLRPEDTESGPPALEGKYVWQREKLVPS